METRVERYRTLARTDHPTMKTSPERRAYQRRYYRKYRSEILEYQRAAYRGIHKHWWKLACIKAGVPASELVNLR